MANEHKPPKLYLVKNAAGESLGKVRGTIGGGRFFAVITGLFLLGSSTVMGLDAYNPDVRFVSLSSGQAVSPTLIGLAALICFLAGIWILVQTFSAKGKIIICEQGIYVNHHKILYSDLEDISVERGMAVKVIFVTAQKTIMVKRMVLTPKDEHILLGLCTLH